jgi:hypothetical protein
LDSEVHFYRACPIHLDEVRPLHENVVGPEVLYCPHGHRVTSWVTMCSDGRVIGQAYKNREGMVVGGRARRKGPRLPSPPTNPCPHGHMDWTYQAATRKYRCASCNVKKEKKSE